MGFFSWLASLLGQNGADVHTDRRSGAAHDPYWDNIPHEENQYNYNGEFDEYFDYVFRDAFPGYTIVRESAYSENMAVFTFRYFDEVKLTVEILSQNSKSYKLRSECKEKNIPYLRFYHDHWGWWNTKEYVVNRVGAVLNS